MKSVGVKPACAHADGVRILLPPGQNANKVVPRAVCTRTSGESQGGDANALRSHISLTCAQLALEVCRDTPRDDLSVPAVVTSFGVDLQPGLSSGRRARQVS